MHSLATIGYESATVRGFLETLSGAGIELLVDIRAVASSRRPGFAKTRLAANLATVGIDYLHLRGLGTPAEGRAAARAGNHAELRRIYLEHLETPEAQAEIETLLDLIRTGRRICLLCLEANPVHCHRSMLAAELASRTALTVVDLHPNTDEDD
jgi:uncharacterized protein (DUF488 family)